MDLQNALILTLTMHLVKLTFYPSLAVVRLSVSLTFCSIFFSAFILSMAFITVLYLLIWPQWFSCPVLRSFNLCQLMYLILFCLLFSLKDKCVILQQYQTLNLHVIFWITVHASALQRAVEYTEHLNAVVMLPS